MMLTILLCPRVVFNYAKDAETAEICKLKQIINFQKCHSVEITLIFTRGNPTREHTVKETRCSSITSRIQLFLWGKTQRN